MLYQVKKFSEGLLIYLCGVLFVCLFSYLFLNFGFCLPSQRCFLARCCWCICSISPQEDSWEPMGTRGPRMMAASASSKLPATRTRAQARRRRRRRARAGGNAQGQASTLGLRWAAASRPGASAHPASSFRRGYIPAPRAPRAAARRFGAGLASGTSGTPTGPARPERSAGSRGGARGYRLHGGWAGNPGTAGLSEVQSPTPIPGGQEGDGIGFPCRATSTVLGRLKEVPGWRAFRAELSSLNYATRRRPCAGCSDEWNQ